MFEFVLGMLMARILMAGRWINLSVPWACALVAVSYGAAMWAPFLYSLTLVTTGADRRPDHRDCRSRFEGP